MPRPSKKPPGEYLAAHFLPFSKAWPEDERKRLHAVLDGLASAIRRYYGRPLYDVESGRHVGKEMPLYEVAKCASNWLQSLHESHDLMLVPRVNGLNLRPDVRRKHEWVQSLAELYALMLAPELNSLQLRREVQRKYDWLQSLHESPALTLAPRISSLHLRREVRRAVELLDQLIRTPDFAAIGAETRKELHLLAGLHKTHTDRRTRVAKEMSVDRCVALANQTKRENPRWGTDKIARNVAEKLSASGSEIKPKTIRNRLKKSK